MRKTQLHMYVCMYVCMNVCWYVEIWMRGYINIYRYIHTYITYIHTYIHTYVHIYTCRNNGKLHADKTGMIAPQNFLRGTLLRDPVAMMVGLGIPLPRVGKNVEKPRVWVGEKKNRGGCHLRPKCHT